MDNNIGGTFAFSSFVQRPLTILRFICIIFAIVVFGCISAGGYDLVDSDKCLFNRHAGACSYGIGIGVIAFLGCIAFIAIEVQLSCNTINNPDTRKYIVLADLGFSTLWCFLWFVGFCYLADMWRRQDKGPFTTSQVNNCQAAVAFSFFSIISWGGLSVMAFTRYRQLLTEFEYSKDNLSGDTYSSPYASFPTPQSQGDPYQSQPFSSDPPTESVPEDNTDKYTPPPY